MIPVGNPQFVLEQREAVKSGHGTLVMNFYVNKDVLGRWIASGDLFHEKIGDTAFFFRRDDDFFHLFYVSPTHDELGRGLMSLSGRPEILVPDVVTKTEEEVSVLRLFRSNGFHHYSTLVRMCVAGNLGGGANGVSDDVAFGSVGDVDRIRDVLTANFDCYAERIPSTAEIAADVADKKFLLIEKHGQIVGLVHYELIGLTSHLRRWFVDPGFRGLNIGSKLLHRYFSLSGKAARFILWVLRPNMNAIERYRHYGYREDGLVDTIFVNREGMCHGG